VDGALVAARQRHERRRLALATHNDGRGPALAGGLFSSAPDSFDSPLAE
jgi:hypothetical protein